MERKYHFIRNTTKLTGITLAVFFFMKWILPMVLPFFIAYYIAGFVRTSKGKQRKHPALRLLIAVAVTGIVFLLFWLLWQEFTELWANRNEILKWEGAKDAGWMGAVYEKLMQQLDVDRLIRQAVQNVGNSFGGMKDSLGGLIAVAVTIVATALMITQYEQIREMMKSNTFGEVVIALAKDLSVAGGDYLKAQGTIMLIITGVCIVALKLVGNEYAVLVGVVIGIFDALPFIGTSIVFIPWAVIVFLQGNIWMGMYYLFLAGATSLLRQFLEPKLIGQRVGANPLMVLISIYLGLQVYGIWGVVLGPASAFLIWEIYRFT